MAVTLHDIANTDLMPVVGIVLLLIVVWIFMGSRKRAGK